MLLGTARRANCVDTSGRLTCVHWVVHGNR